MACGAPRLASVRPADLDHLRDLAKVAANGELTRSDALALFILLREIAPAQSMLRDVGDSIAHSTRDRGYAHRYVSGFVQHVTDAFARGGELDIPVAFEVGGITNELADALDRLTIEPDRSALHRQSRQMVNTVGSLLQGTEILLPGVGVTVYLSVVADVQPALLMTFTSGRGGAVPIEAGTQVAFPMLEHRIG